MIHVVFTVFTVFISAHSLRPHANKKQYSPRIDVTFNHLRISDSASRARSRDLIGPVMSHLLIPLSAVLRVPSNIHLLTAITSGTVLQPRHSDCDEQEVDNLKLKVKLKLKLKWKFDSK